MKHMRQQWKECFRRIVRKTAEQCQRCYGERLVAVVVFGSVGRGDMRPDSDIDLLVVADPLPRRRLARVAEFRQVEEAVAPLLEECREQGVTTMLSPVFRTPAEIRRHPPLLLDMTEDAWILYDRDHFFARELENLRRRLRELGARRHRMGHAWWWDLKPDYTPGEVFEI